MSQLSTQLWAKLRMGRHLLASVRRESRLKVAFVSISAALLWVGAFAVARAGFAWLDALAGPAAAGALTDLLLARLLAAFALLLMSLLTVSNILVAYATLYRSQDMGFLLRTPIATAPLFLGRFVESISLSSWASAYLASPVLLAYGLARDAAPTFYLAAVVFFVPFVVLPAALGNLTAMVGVRLLVTLAPGWRRVTAVIAAAATWVVVRSTLTLPRLGDDLSFDTLSRSLGYTQNPWLPSVWLSRGVLDAAAGRLGEAAFSFLLLLANASLLLWLTVLVAERWLLDGWHGLHGAGGGRRRRATFLGRIDGLLRAIPQPSRALVAKDLRMFWRDPAQWSQFLLFFGILIVYVANLRRSTATFSQEPWTSWIALLNIAACLLVLSTLTTRFVFPLVSLEGRRFWVLGLAPLTRGQVAWQKFWLSVVTTSVLTLGLAVVSAWQLRLAPLAFGVSVAGVAAATVGLSGLAVGLGSLYPNFDEDNPARVVSGMGGTLNFLLSLIYVVLLVGLLATVLHGPRLGAAIGVESSGPIGWIAALGIALGTAAATLLPMRLGIRNLERAEL